MADLSLRERTNHMAYFVMLQCADPEQFKLVAMPLRLRGAKTEWLLPVVAAI